MSDLRPNQTIVKPEGIVSKIRTKPFYYLFAFLLFINIALIFVNIGIWFIAAHQKLFIIADFTSFYTGFKMVMNGDGSKLYDLGLQAIYQQKIMGNIRFEGGLLPYVYPPFFAILFAPLALIPVNSAFYIWTVGELGLLIWLIILLLHLVADWSIQERLILMVILLAYWPLTGTFTQGQFSILLLISMLQMYTAMRRSRLYLAGFWLSLLVIRPQTLPLLGIITLNKRFWRIAVTTAISCFAIIILSSALLGNGIWIRFIQTLPNILKNFRAVAYNTNSQYTFRGVLTNMLVNSQANVINIISIVVFIICGIFVWLLWLKGVAPDSTSFPLYFAFTVMLSAFFSLHLNPHDDLILVLPAILMYDYLRMNNYPKNAFSTVLLISPPAFFIAAFYDFNLLGFIHPPVVLIFCLLVWVGYYLILERRKQQITPSTTQSS